MSWLRLTSCAYAFLEDNPYHFSSLYFGILYYPHSQALYSLVLPWQGRRKWGGWGGPPFAPIFLAFELNAPILSESLRWIHLPTLVIGDKTHRPSSFQFGRTSAVKHSFQRQCFSSWSWLMMAALRQRPRHCFLSLLTRINNCGLLIV